MFSIFSNSFKGKVCVNVSVIFLPIFFQLTPFVNV